MNIKKVGFNSPSFGAVTKIAAKQAMKDYKHKCWEGILNCVTKGLSDNENTVSLYRMPIEKRKKDEKRKQDTYETYYMVENKKYGTKLFIDFYTACIVAFGKVTPDIMRIRKVPDEEMQKEILSYCV